MTDFLTDAVMRAAFPDHANVGQEPTMTNPCNGVLCGCHPQAATDEPDWSAR